jgi:methylated-DNA-[protein]-cysteine S-methyltransferase
MRTVSGVEWDVPVELVRGTPMPGDRRSVRDVDPGVALPGVAALNVTLQRHDGRDLLVGIAAEVRGRRPGATSLAALLDELRESGDGRVGVLGDGTPFTRTVLEALLRVPAGERITYADLAGLAGRPRAVRAAASVMARNRVPLVVPCHRIVPSTGSTGRYAWGEAVKSALLEVEATRCAAAPA